MATTDLSAIATSEIPQYCGRGTSGWRLAAEGDERAADHIVRIDAGSTFGGEWDTPQIWEVLQGEGEISRDGDPGREKFVAGNTASFEAGLRRLLIATTDLQLLITEKV
jgi:hypothetical protein